MPLPLQVNTITAIIAYTTYSQFVFQVTETVFILAGSGNIYAEKVLEHFMLLTQQDLKSFRFKVYV